MVPRTKARLLFGSALLLVSLGGSVAFVAISRLLDSEAWVTHTHEVQIALSQVSNVVSRVGRLRTQYADSGDSRRLEEYQSAVAQVHPALNTLKDLIVDNPTQVKRVEELETIIERRIGLTDQAIALKERGQSTLEGQARITQSIVSVAGEMDLKIQTMMDQEQLLLELRTSRLRRGEHTAAILLGSTFTLAVVLFILHYRLLNVELEGRQHAEASLRKLSARILQIQDEERRKFSRELHDSLGQYLVGAKMNLDILGRTIPTNELIADSTRLLEEALAETRTISHLLHPPLLDETGFASAAQWYVEGFSKRSGVATKLEIPERFDRLPALVEIAMFRILQEALTNIHRHSESSLAEIIVRVQRERVVLTIHDNGSGIPPEVLQRVQSDRIHPGVGLAGMRERVRELGGRLDITSNSTGTMIMATFPIPILLSTPK
jgi:signal transduction histidine kinase